MALDIGLLEVDVGFLKVQRVKVEGEIHFIVHGDYGVNGEVSFML